jgi:threonine synthase
MRAGIIERYRQRLPVTDRTPVITLGEGDTPLIRARHIEEVIGPDIEVYLKFEGANPTGSFKDRGMTVAVSKAVEEGSKAVVCASTGNTSASAAAYAARAGLRCIVVLPGGRVALGKLSQALMCGAKVIPVKGNFDQALTLVREMAASYPVTLVNSLNPNRIEGQKTGAFEVVDALGRAPDWHFMPVGNAGNITAYWRGYKEYHADGRCALPRMMGFQAEGAAPIVRGRPIANPETVATAIRIGNPASWKQAEAARDESSGAIDCVSDEEILRAYQMIAGKEGVFAEPASAAAVAGLLKYAAAGRLHPDSRAARPIAVCVLTGHGLKDPERAVAMCKPPRAVPARLDAVLREAGL